MPGQQTTLNVQQASTGEGSSNDGSKFKRFLKRFGRHPSDDAHAQTSDSAQVGQLVSNDQNFANEANGVLEGGGDTGRRFGSTRNWKESKGKNGNLPKGRRSDALLAGRFFQSSTNAPALPKAALPLQSSTASSPGAEKTMKAAFSESTDVGGLANTLTLPPEQTSPPPRLQGLPRHVPIATGELLQVSATPDPAPERVSEHRVNALTAEEAKESSDSKKTANQIAPQPMQGKTDGEHIAGATTNGVAEHHDVTALSPQSSYSSRRSGGPPSFDSGSAALDRVRDSVDNRTMDTNKSRASTKPTTLMSMDTRENVQNTVYAPMAQIAQHRSGEHGPGTASQIRSTPGRIPSDNSGAPSTQQHAAIHFASAPPLGRTASGTIVQLPGQDDAPEEALYTNVPSLSRPHPANNPHPAGVPADNASMLTLASSTAAASIGGGAASSRGHSHAAPSFGGARSIGGSLMGERRNSSDTYASVKALPPLSRRGSDASARTGMSIAASATGLNSAQAVLAHAAYAASGAGPGAPADRVSIHRTPSQRTVATQLSIPLSSSTHAFTGAQGDIAPPATLESASALLAASPAAAPATTTVSSAHDAGKDAQVAIHADPTDATETPTAIAVPSIRTTPVSHG